jgi:type II secretory pathway component PulM
MTVALFLKDQNTRKTIVTFLLLAILVLVIAYMYFLSMSVAHVVMRKEAVHQARIVESEIAKLETEYMLAQHVVSDAIASTDMLAENNDKIFVSRKPATVAVSQ